MTTTICDLPAEGTPAEGTPGGGTESPFAALGLPAWLIRSVSAAGFTAPTDIQAQAIPALLAGRDVVGVARTGTGKTAAFGLPLLTQIDPQNPATQALVLTPTRELALQVARALSDFAASAEASIRVAAIYGGAPYSVQKRDLAAGAQVVVGTPGRVIDHLEQGTLRLDQLAYLVLDEADEMLRMGFAEDVDRILATDTPARQTALFSATWPPAIERTAQAHLSNPVELRLGQSRPTVAATEQRYAVVPQRHKLGALARLLQVHDAAGIVFVRTRAAVEEVVQGLAERGVPATGISGEVSQAERERIVKRLRAGGIDWLVATDVAARGLDVDRIGLVINFDLPREPESYVHRIGRTGRAGRTGQAITLVAPHEQRKLGRIERHIHAKLERLEVPSPRDVTAHRAAAVAVAASGRLTLGRLDACREALTEALADSGHDPLDFAAAILAVAVGDSGIPARSEAETDSKGHFDRPRGGERNDRRRSDHEGGYWGGGRDTASPSRRPRQGAHQSKRYWIGVGHRHGVRPGGIVGAITGESGLRGGDLGRIDMFANYSLVEIMADLSKDTIQRLSRARLGGQALRLRPDRPK
ncbi:MAG: DEAD/DEAH box helicase [Bifidobacteriaceae bacterium]|jgi:ATP-dependent RNA helicase DeaD|nr:DEAD/DEAH box helicase [Bifidobacteriaceae bacterium]